MSKQIDAATYRPDLDQLAARLCHPASAGGLAEHFAADDGAEPPEPTMRVTPDAVSFEYDARTGGGDEAFAALGRLTAQGYEGTVRRTNTHDVNAWTLEVPRTGPVS